MPIDASIPLQVKPFQMPDQMNALARAMQIKGLQQDGELGQMKMDEYKRSIEDKNQLRSALSAPGADAYNVLLQRGDVKGATEFRKGQADYGKTNAEADYKKIETAHKRIDMMGQALGWLRQNPTADNASQTIRYLADNGVVPPERVQELMAKLQSDPSPQGVAAFAELGYRAALSTKDQLPKYETRNLGGTTDTLAIDPVTGQARTANSVQNTQSPDNAASNARTAADNAASRAVQLRGQDLINDRARESNSAGKVPSGYRQKPDGSLEFIPGGPADPNAAKKAAPTEFQGKAGMFGNRAEEADKIIAALEGKYSPTGINTKQALGRTPLLGGALESAGNLALSDNSQKAEQAQRDFVNAVLRLESGAAISAGEFDNASKQYFPQPGDSQAVITQKAQNRKTAIQGLKNNARPGASDASAPAAPAGGKTVTRTGTLNGRKVVQYSDGTTAYVD